MHVYARKSVQRRLRDVVLNSLSLCTPQLDPCDMKPQHLMICDANLLAINPSSFSHGQN